jgi:hypothetical protein
VKKRKVSSIILFGFAGIFAIIAMLTILDGDWNTFAIMIIFAAILTIAGLRVRSNKIESLKKRIKFWTLLTLLGLVGMLIVAFVDITTHPEYYAKIAEQREIEKSEKEKGKALEVTEKEAEEKSNTDAKKQDEINHVPEDSASKTFPRQEDVKQIKTQTETEAPPTNEQKPTNTTGLDKTFQNNLNSCLSKIGINGKDIDEIHEMNDWYNGERYWFEYDGHNFYIYANADYSINSINMDVVVRTTDPLTGKKEMIGHMIKCYMQGYESYNYKDVLNDIDNLDKYENNKSRKAIPSETEKKDSNPNTIILRDGEIGQYGKQDGDYIDYYLPAGKYKAISKNGNVKIALVNNSNDEDYSFIAEFTEIGQSKTINIKSGYHIELTMYGEVELKKK